MLLLLKCFDIKKVKSLNDLVIIDWVLGGEPTKKIKKIKNIPTTLIVAAKQCGRKGLLKYYISL